jgi:aryl-alcohol dehydrogenase-like predicted oxidoreductase
MKAVALQATRSVQGLLEPVQPSRRGVNETLTIGDLVVRRLGFGAMSLTGPGVWGNPRDPGSARKVLRRAVELGVNFVDTADSYGPETGELLIAEALRPYPPDLVVATKGGFRRPGPGRWEPEGRPEHLHRACEGSLRRLGLDRIDLYQLHTVDPDVPLEESVGALAELERQGKIRHVGLSNVSVDELDRARGIIEIVSVQNRYNLVDRRADAVLRRCEAEGLAFVCWLPLVKGLVSRSTALRRLGRAHEATAAQLALAWLLHRSALTLPIPGTASPRHLDENVGALGVRLSEAEWTALDEYRPSTPERLRTEARRAARRAAGAVRRASAGRRRA